MRYILLICGVLVLAGCVTRPTPHEPVNVDPADWEGSSAAVHGGAGNKSPYTVFGQTYRVMPDSLGYLEIGVASWYGRKFHGNLTSNGEVFDMFSMTAAHRTLPIPTIVRVTNLDNGRKAIVRVNDRGPFHDNRIIDLSWQVAVQLGFADKGTAPVVVEALDERNYPERHLQMANRKSFYLQVGAFSRPDGAERRSHRIRRLMETSAITHVGVKVLQSELENRILHKVWLGPIGSEQQMDQLAQLVESADLGVPLRVEVE